ncbi:hypothetical protein N798_05555 [Knoellia flava TL1]|uniref:Uncharacterized protein n=2 Tax=Knoellia flava TaxID=913969 RepID=A0A8H9FSG1_9MICO|nr:hypothetical protein [Knoellia flava]KGN33609.1 hypothetical protein N798_05555 [Knoellia flava TL1]GGB74272.1 hypothetical protein GCM10011314_12180 [Knoellia flava]
MTLVLTYVSRDYDVMVGDTRLCIPDPKTGKLIPFNEDAIKFAHTRGLLFGFAGVAGFSRIPTTDWLRRKFEKSDLDLEAGLAALAQELDARFQRGDVKGMPLIVTIAGWVLNESDDSLTPVVATVTNQDPHTFKIMTSFKHEWSVHPADAGWVATGQISPERRAQVQQDLEKVLHPFVKPDVIANVFLRALRGEAAENVTVGERARVATLPLSVLTLAREQDDDHFIVWRVREPILVDGQPTEVELEPDQTAVGLVRVEHVDFSQAYIID